MFVVDERGREVLSDISLGVLNGEALAIVGRNGSGKSTLLRVLAGLHAPSSGTVSVLGQDPYNMTYAETQAHRLLVAFSFEAFGLWPTRTIGENIGLPLSYHGKDANLAREVADELGVLDAMDLFPGQVNASIKKRALIGRALAVAPVILLCDEPQAGLVRREAKRCAEAIEKRRKEGLTVVYADHDGDVEPYIVTRRVYLEEGRLTDRASMLPPSLRPDLDDELPPASLGPMSVRGGRA